MSITFTKQAQKRNSQLCSRTIPKSTITSLLSQVLPYIERHGNHNDNSLDDLLPVGVHADEGEAVVDNAEDEHAGDDAGDGSDAAHQRNAADDAGRDGVQFVAHAASSTPARP